MLIRFIPVRQDAALCLERAGDALIVNGRSVDVAALAEAGPGEEPPCEGVLSAVRGPGGLEVAVLLPVAADAPEAARFPAPVLQAEDGPVPLPGQGGDQVRA